MNKLVVQPTSTSQWLELVKEAAALSCHNLSEDTESYLVFLLMRFAQSPEIAKKVVATDFLESHNLSGNAQAHLRKEVGDNCLIFSGLFPGRARARRVRISYYINIGKSAYGSLVNETNQLGNDLYAQLSNEFISLTEVMHSMREVDGFGTSLDPLQAMELWSDTGSNKAKKVITNSSTNATLITSELLASNQKH